MEDMGNYGYTLFRTIPFRAVVRAIDCTAFYLRAVVL